MNTSIGNILIEAARELQRNASALLLAVAVPALLAALLETFKTQYQQPFPISLLTTIAMFFLYGQIAVTCHRIILLGPDSLPNRWGIYATAPVWRFFGAMLVFLGIWMMGMMLIIPFVTPMLMAVEPGAARILALLIFSGLALVAILAMSRVVLLFPSLAVSGGHDVNDIIELSAPVWARLAAIMLLAGIATAIVAFPLTWLGLATDSFVIELTSALIGCLAGIYTVAAISCAYRAVLQVSPARADSERVERA
ncbi:MAG: hypothetical protein GVY32_06110 [Gammaproteobacteria bacterium]|jgi:hypothetical protein|nr:hypothetical protein [Gammaproteobacteria bacterium]